MTDKTELTARDQEVSVPRSLLECILYHAKERLEEYRYWHDPACGINPQGLELDEVVCALEKIIGARTNVAEKGSE